MFTLAEERQFREAALPRLEALRGSSEYAAMAFNVGKLYWYNYAADGTGAPATRSERIRAAAQWMRDAASDAEFEQHALAQAYADIADFETRIVPLINEGSDAGLYAPYFEQLSFLVDELASEENDVVRLETANLALDALCTYPRKFRADDVEQEQLFELASRAEQLVSSVHPTTDALDGERARALALVGTARQAVTDAYEDVEA